jgi:hypothetical protein
VMCGDPQYFPRGSLLPRRSAGRHSNSRRLNPLTASCATTRTVFRM